VCRFTSKHIAHATHSNSIDNGLQIWKSNKIKAFANILSVCDRFCIAFMTEDGYNKETDIWLDLEEVCEECSMDIFQLWENTYFELLFEVFPPLYHESDESPCEQYLLFTRGKEDLPTSIQWTCLCLWWTKRIYWRQRRPQNISSMDVFLFMMILLVSRMYQLRRKQKSSRDGYKQVGKKSFWHESSTLEMFFPALQPYLFTSCVDGLLNHSIPKA